MKERELNIALREMAREQGLCDEWYGQWPDDDTIDNCLERYIRGFDFVVKNNYPPLDFCRKYFDKEVLHRHNIYLDEEVAITDANNGYYVFLGNCKAELWATGYKAVSIYCRHNSVVNVKAFDGASVMVRYYDASHGICNSDRWSKITKLNRNKK